MSANGSSSNHSGEINPIPWMTWLVGVLVMLSITRNFLYLCLIVLCLNMICVILSKQTNAMGGLISPFRLTVMITLMASVFNMLTSHAGETRLATIPGNLPYLSGAITLEALVYGCTNGMVLSGLFLSFYIIHLVLPTRAFLQLVPRAYHSLAVIAAIAITYIPSTMQQFHQIREAQTIRGHRLRRVSDWLPLLMPLLLSGLERALQLAEAMTARGFASQEQPSSPVVARLALVIGLVITILGLLPRIFPTSMMWVGESAFYIFKKSNWLLVAGGLIFASSLWFQGSHIRRPRYQGYTWSIRDWDCILAIGLPLSIFALHASGQYHASLFYNPYPLFQIPVFDNLTGISLLGLLGILVNTSRDVP